METKTFLDLPVEIKNTRLLLVAKLNEYFAYPNVGTLRQWIFNAESPEHKDPYGVLKFITKLGGRRYVKIPEFLEWLENQGQVA